MVAGATGFVGTAVVRGVHGGRLRGAGRSGAPAMSPGTDPARIAQAIDGSDVLVNLAGKSVNCRYTDRNRDEILRSRVETTRALREAVTGCRRPAGGVVQRVDRDHLPARDGSPEHRSRRRARRGILRRCREELGARVLRGRPAAHPPRRAADGDRRSATARRRTRCSPSRASGLGGPQIDGWWFPHRRYRGIGPTPTGQRPPAVAPHQGSSEVQLGAPRRRRRRHPVPPRPGRHRRTGEHRQPPPDRQPRRSCARCAARSACGSVCPPGDGCSNRRCGRCGPSPNSCSRAAGSCREHSPRRASPSQHPDLRHAASSSHISPRRVRTCGSSPWCRGLHRAGEFVGANHDAPRIGCDRGHLARVQPWCGRG